MVDLGQYITQWQERGHDGWREDREAQGATDLQTAREFRDRLRHNGLTARVVARTDIVVD